MRSKQSCVLVPASSIGKHYPVADDSKRTRLSNASPIREISFYIGEHAIRLGLGAVVGVFVARYLRPEGLGLLSYGASIFGLLVPMSSLGMRSILVRDFATEENWRPFLVAGLSRQLPAAILASVAGALLVMATRGFEPDAVAVALALSLLPIFSLGDTLRALLEAKGRMRRIAVVSLSAVVVTSTLKIVAIVLDYPISVFALLITVEAGVVAAGLFWERLKKGVIGSVRYHYSKEVAGRIVRESWPLLLASVAVTLYMKVDIAMLGALAGNSETGIYVAATRLSEVWYFVPVAAAAALRPRLSRHFKRGETDTYQTLTQRFLSSSFATSTVVAVFMWLAARPLVDFIYGPEFSEATPVLQIHIFAAPFVFMGVASSQWFIDHGLTRAVMMRAAVGAAVNIGINFLLIPAMGSTGAAIATLVSYAISAMILNGLNPSTRPIFMMQLRALRVAWK